MRLARLIPAAALTLCLSGAAFAQGWFEYTNKDGLFSVNFPAEPRIEEFTYISEYKSKLNAKRYIAEDKGARYTVTVVDMSRTDYNPQYHGNELRGAVDYAATELRQTGKVTYDAYAEINVIPGHALQITHPDGKRNFVAIHYHAKKLYITEAVVPANVPPPILFQASFQITDAEGRALRYEDNNHSFPDGRVLSRRGGAAVAGAAAPAPAAAGR